jgi:thiol-disulfide isomerase/thioredoxin
MFLAGILAVGLGCGSAETPTGAGSAPPAKSSAPYLVKIHADWCGVCTRLTPVWNRLEEEYGDSVQMVLLDVSDRDAVELSSQEADRLGLGQFFDSYRGRTGTIAVLDAGTGEPQAVFIGEMDFAKYQTALETVLERGGA